MYQESSVHASIHKPPSMFVNFPLSLQIEEKAPMPAIILPPCSTIKFHTQLLPSPGLSIHVGSQ